MLRTPASVVDWRAAAGVEWAMEVARGEEEWEAAGWVPEREAAREAEALEEAPEVLEEAEREEESRR